MRYRTISGHIGAGRCWAINEASWGDFDPFAQVRPSKYRDMQVTCKGAMIGKMGLASRQR